MYVDCYRDWWKKKSVLIKSHHIEAVERLHTCNIIYLYLY